MHDIDTALDAIRARDAAAARLAKGLWGAIRVGAAHPEKVTRYDVQSMCWGTLPLLDDAGPGAAAVLAELLDLLGYPRYAEICRGETTRRIVEADPDERPALVRDAWARSGVEPPDTAVLAWGEVRGPLEQAVHAGVGRILEEAAADGMFDASTAEEVRMLRVGITVKVLSSPAEGRSGSWYLQIFEERLEAWLTAGGSQTRRELMVRIRPDVARVPRASGDDLAAARLLVDVCRGGGVRLTRNGYLPTDLVRELVGLMPVCAIYTGGRSEKSWPPVSTLRYLLTETEFLREDGNRLVLTESGQDRSVDPETLTKCLGEALVAKDTSIRGVIQEVALAALLLEDGVELDRILDKAAIVVEEEGWAPVGNGPPIDELTRDYAWLFLQRLYVLDMLEVDESRRRTTLTPAGRTATLWALRARVMLREVVS